MKASLSFLSYNFTSLEVVRVKGANEGSVLEKSDFHASDFELSCRRIVQQLAGFSKLHGRDGLSEKKKHFRARQFSAPF